MPVTEDKIIIMGGFQYIAGKAYQPFVFKQFLLLSVGIGQTAMLRPSVGNTHTKVWVQTLKQLLAQRAAEHFFEYFVFIIAGAQAIAVVQIELFALPF